MKNRASLLLMELLVMILVFSLASAVCLELFAETQQLSRQTRQQDKAVLLAQNVAEQLKVGKIPENKVDGLDLHIKHSETGFPGLHQAEISVACEGGILYTLTVGYREVAQ